MEKWRGFNLELQHHSLYLYDRCFGEKLPPGAPTGFPRCSSSDRLQRLRTPTSWSVRCPWAISTFCRWGSAPCSCAARLVTRSSQFAFSFTTCLALRIRAPWHGSHTISRQSLDSPSSFMSSRDMSNKESSLTG